VVAAALLSARGRVSRLTPPFLVSAVILLPAVGDRDGAVSWRMPDRWKAVRSRSSGDSIGAITLALLFGLFNLIFGIWMLAQGTELRRTQKPLHPAPSPHTQKNPA
jgi:hypothetical protein